MERLCVFDVGMQRVALPMDCVRETVPSVELTPMILAGEFVLGLFALRGEILSVLNLSSFIGAPAIGREAQSAGAPPSFLIIEKGELRFAVPVRRVTNVEIDGAQLEPHPQSALYPALHARGNDASGPFDLLQFERLRASLTQALGFERLLQSA